MAGWGWFKESLQRPRFLKGTGFSPYVESGYRSPALAAGGMQILNSCPSEAKAQSFGGSDVRAEARTLRLKPEADLCSAKSTGQTAGSRNPSGWLRDLLPRPFPAPLFRVSAWNSGEPWRDRT